MTDQATIDYYNSHAKEYVQRTGEMEMDSVRGRFLHYLAPGSYILDGGCGSGRDSVAFIKLGYKILATDAAAELVSHVKTLGVPVAKLSFEEIDFVEKFDGIWTSASLVHVPRAELNSVITKMGRALKKGGVWFVSFKMGEGEKVENGRYFNFLTEEKLREYFKDFEVLETWQHKSDINLVPTIWLNTILRKPK